MKKKAIDVNLTQRHRAESDPVVAAASILARAAFVSTLNMLSRKAEITLPKGASSQVKATARALVSRHGKGILPSFAKMHFKTASDL